MKKSKKLAAIAAVAIVAIAALVIWHTNFNGGTPRGASANTMEQAQSKIRKVLDKQAKKRQAGKVDSDKDKKTKKKRTPRTGGDAYSELPPEERKLAKAVQDALDEDDFNGVQKAAQEALKCANPDVRRDAVDALAWFGEKALADLTPLMSDRDEDVAQAAIDGWEQGLSEIEEPSDRLNISYLALSALQDENALEAISSQFSYAATDYIDGTDDEKVERERRVEVVQSLVDMISSPNAKTSKAGKELYEEVTGNRWINLEEAEKYVANPDEYEEPDED